MNKKGEFTIKEQPTPEKRCFVVSKRAPLQAVELTTGDS